jgi:ABC-type antimicrobial peptide transport system permease subunit
MRPLRRETPSHPGDLVLIVRLVRTFLQAVSNVLTMQQAIGDSLGNARFSAALVMGFAVLSLILASVGLYGVLSYLMAQRATELGVRMALGAQRGQLLRLILFDGMRPAIVGLAIGSAASAGITQLIRSMLYDTRPLDPAVYVAVYISDISGHFGGTFPEELTPVVLSWRWDRGKLTGATADRALVHASGNPRN